MSTLGHTWRVIREALKADKARRAAHVSSHEADFLPAALAVVESPVSPTGRRTAYALLGLLVATFAWLVF
eukprot:gene25481-biopygen10005